MGHIVNINQQEPLKMMQHVPVMVAMKTMFALHYSIFLQRFFPSFIYFFSNWNFVSLSSFLPLFEQQFPSIISLHAVQLTPFWVAAL